jgi:rhodanese-related sulfurtransferase
MKFIRHIFVGGLFVFFILGISGCSEDNVAYKNVTAVQLKEVINAKNTYLLDVRTAPELVGALEKIDVAKHIPLHELEYRYSEVPKNKNIYIICRSGNRSIVASKIFLQHGYKNVYNVLGGMRAWVAIKK